MKRPRIEEVAGMHDWIQENILPNVTGNQYHLVYGAYRALQWVLGFDRLMVGEKFEDVLREKR